MEMSERLLLARTTLGESQSSFARGIGMQQGSYSDFERGRRVNFAESTLLLLEINFGISRDWLLHGVGEMLISADNADARENTLTMRRKIKEQEEEIERLKSIIEKIKNIVE